MSLGVVAQAAGMFAVTNIDDILILALFFARVRGRPRGASIVVIGQYLGFAGIVAAAVVGALGAGLLPESVLPYLGILPLLLGIRAAWTAWRERHDSETDSPNDGDVGILTVATVTLANGGDNIGVYVPVLANAGTAGMVTYVAVFLVLVAVWCATGRFFATRPPVARTLARWGHIILPVVLIGIGLVILIEGGAFGI
ncbi:cadmium resistance protein CadD (predicted permease) [Pseudonocardia sediminis]|uniref:Cadmium resistance protein CadD (Predicted permease) n=1 Tax=Pseudonocardia sediminis TaxID=1397368 RepID=A0A4Q7UXB5_PSEST|nr:cadmium resistance transporter [Pseudonocardia sediminis]RZT85678.1 cadmium resistance protein CadD (predicted permease) [Pseudonocardia sediminis]